MSRLYGTYEECEAFMAKEGRHCTNPAEHDIPGPGKFEGNESLALSEFLYAWSMNGQYVESYGSVTENGLWEGLIVFGDDGVFEAVNLKPAYLVWEDSNGFFSYKGFDTEEEARSKYMANLAAYESYYT